MGAVMCCRSADSTQRVAWVGRGWWPALLPLLLCLAGGTLRAEDTPEGIDFFESKIRPILVTHCYECHSVESKKSKGGLLLDTRAALLQGGDSGPAIVPGDAENSVLIAAVRQTDKELRMPPKQKLTETQIADLEAWVKLGAPDPRKSADKGSPRLSLAPSGMSLEEGRKFWAFLPVSDPQRPTVKRSDWARNAVDDFILDRLERAGVEPAPAADKPTLLRRVTFDLHGLPPTPEELEAFLADSSPQAFENVVDRLLASPRYGERWGRHWLDVVRYADTCGNASDFPVPQAHKYRDWVIRAINRDLPYDEFVREQIAGDLLPANLATSGTEAERYERIVATGYLAIARRFGGDRMGEHHLTLEDTIDNVGRAFLGSSIACARCHDHKFDPFTQSDYYGLYGIFSSTRYPFPGAEVGPRQEDFVPLMQPAEIEALLKPFREKTAVVEAEVKQLEMLEAEIRKIADIPEKQGLVTAAAQAVAAGRKRRGELQAQAPVINTAYAVAEAAGANARLQVRGDPKRLGDEVPRHFPAVLGGQELPKEGAISGRLQLATWLTDRQNPLTARVMVNRIWQQHFGKGIVQTPNDFGRQGRAPTHPELLDFLAARFMENNWSMKAMHKLLLLSQTWQLSSSDVAESARLDPAVDLFWKFPRRRLDAESIRDALLFVSGDLDENSTGTHPFPATHTWRWTQHNPFVANYDTRRRSVYLMQQRLRRNPYLALFDGADPSSSTGVRLPSTTPLQALFLMNDPLVHGAAGKFVRRVTASTADETARIGLAYAVALNRAPAADEQQECREFLQKYRERLAALNTPADQRDGLAWTALGRALLSSNEFVFVD